MTRFRLKSSLCLAVASLGAAFPVLGQTVIDASQRQARAADFAPVTLPAVDPALLQNTILTSRPAPAKPNVQLQYDAGPVAFVYPNDTNLIRWITVKNNGAYTELEFDATVSGPGGFSIPANQLGVGPLPQPGYLYLEPGESQRIWITAGWNELGNGSWSPGNTYTYRIDIRVYAKRTSGQIAPDPATLQTATLQNTIRAVDNTYCKPADGQGCAPLPRNAALAGKVFDKYTGKPIAGAQVTQISTTILTGVVTSDSSGAYTVNLIAYQAAQKNVWEEYGVTVKAPGYADFHAVVAPHDGDRVLLDVPMIPAPSPALQYAVESKTDTVLNLNRSDASRDGQAAALVQFHSAIPDGVDPQSYGAQARLWFVAGGRVAWQFPLYGQTPAVAVSDDGSLVATARPDLARGDDGIYLLDNTGKIVWPAGYPGSAASLRNANGDVRNSIYEVRISHDNRYLAAGDTQGNLWLLDIRTQKLVWQRFLNGQVRALAFDSDDATLYAGAGDGYWYALRMDGTLAWRTYMGGWAIAFAVSSHYIAAGGKEGYFVALLDKQTGAVLWEYPVSASPGTVAFAPDESYVLVQSTSNTFGTLVFGIDGVLRVHEFPSDPAFITADGGGWLQAGYNLGPPGTHGGPMWVKLMDSTGASLWSATLDSSFQTGPGGYAWVSPDKSRMVIAHGSWIYSLSQQGPRSGASAVASAASYSSSAASGVSPGEIVTIFGQGMGPAQLAGPALDGSGNLATVVAGTEVLFDNTPGPLIYTSSGQVSAIAPYDLAGKRSVAVTVQYQGASSVPAWFTVVPANPAIFTLDSSGRGDAAIIHLDGSPVNSANPAFAGELLMLYGEGYGIASPALPDGAIVGGTLPQPVASTLLLIDGQPVATQYCGAAPAEVNGILQVNFQVPQLAAGVHQIQLQVGDRVSPSGVVLRTR